VGWGVLGFDLDDVGDSEFCEFDGVILGVCDLFGEGFGHEEVELLELFLLLALLHIRYQKSISE
jgi:hypothetical protein